MHVPRSRLRFVARLLGVAAAVMASVGLAAPAARALAAAESVRTVETADRKVELSLPVVVAHSRGRL